MVSSNICSRNMEFSENGQLWNRSLQNADLDTKGEDQLDG